MKQKDFESVLTKTFDKKVNVDATKDGKDFIKYFSFNDAEKEVFLGGTCNESKWRDEIIPLLEKAKVAYFNPVVEDWNDAARQAEEEAKLRCGIHLYVITPKMTGVYAIAEAVKSATINPKGTIFVVLQDDENILFTDSQFNSLYATVKLLSDLGAWASVLSDASKFDEVVKFISKIKRGFASTLVIQMQSHPVKFGGIHGIQHYDIMNMVRNIIHFFNDVHGDAYNMATIKHLKKAKESQEARTAGRKNRKVEGYDKY